MKPSTKIILSTLAVVLLVLAAAILHFQDYVKVEIFVRDGNDRPINQAEIIITKFSLSSDKPLYTNEHGYIACYLPIPAIENIVISKKDFDTAVLSGHLITNRPIVIVLNKAGNKLKEK